jgi:7-cyano-7-deazaguanine synthase
MVAELARSYRQVFPVYIRSGLAWERAELRTLRKFLLEVTNSRIQPLTVLSVPMDDLAGGHWSVPGRGVPGYRAPISSNYLLGRNLRLLTKAALFCAFNRVGELAIAPLESNPFPDTRPEFFAALSRAVQLGVGLKLDIRSPYAGLTKADVVRRSRGLPLCLTLSCAQPVGLRHCGKCTKCAERIAGFRAAGIADPTVYVRRAGVRM